MIHRRKKATDLTDAGCLSLDDLVSGRFNSMLSSKQILNVKYVHHLEQPATREQAEDVLVRCVSTVSVPRLTFQFY